ncbi:hypothetical protein FYJ24_06965 [Actinomycetaceae bacterium WB03_NA08]|uniref:Uncharacterized protein n=1 Tax=Scrofimicrobium canadense TaxID=2652290 RepID=A0A6N7W8P5_9ACTO|nr:hypothetical protein [Scrofimicrobium canadense]MSS84508.1 hypothetical protein [Scrofimicrobium canadense]
MTTDQEMRQLADSATEGPWEANQNDLTGEWKVEYDQEQQWLIAEVGGGDWNAKNDAEFIAACRDWVPEALKRLEAIEAVLSSYPECDTYPPDGPIGCGWKRDLMTIKRIMEDQ